MTYRLRRPRLALALAVTATLVAALAPTPGRAQTPPAPGPRVGDNVRVNTEPESTRGRDAPGLAVNPTNPDHLVEVDVDALRGRCDYSVSFNRGNTWTGGTLSAQPLPGDAAFPSPDSGYPNPLCDAISSAMSDGSVAFGSGQNVYVPFATRRSTSEGFTAVVARSTDGGRTFEPARVAMWAPPGTSSPSYTRPELVAEPGGGAGGADRLYVSASRTAPGVTGSRTFVAISNDGGLTWPSAPPTVGGGANPEHCGSATSRHCTNASGNPTAPVPGAPTQYPEAPEAPAQGSIEPSEPVVGPDGNVYVAWRTQSVGTNPLGSIMVSKSVDKGQTWTRRRVATVRGYGPDPAGSTFNASSFPRLAVDPRPLTGTPPPPAKLYVTWMQGPSADNPPGVSPVPPPTRSASFKKQDHFIHPDADVAFSRSHDGGVTWSSPPLRVNDDPVGTGAPAAGPAQRHPRPRVAPNGRIDIVWQDRRHGYKSPTNSHFGNGEARFGDTYYAFSRDEGGTFSANRRISDKSQNLDVGNDYRAGVYWNFAPALVSLENEAIFAWMDSREGNSITETEDIYLARVNLAASGPVPVRRLPETANPGTSVAVSQLSYQAGPESVLNVGFTALRATKPVVVNEGDPAAALAGSVLARANLGPVLLSRASALPGDVQAEVSRLAPVGAFVIGDESQLSAGVVATLRGSGVPEDRIERIAGPTPAHTAKLIADRLPRRGDTAVVVNPNTPEASAASALAATLRFPVVFVDRDSVPEPTAQVLGAPDIRNALIIGGPGAVSDTTMAQVAAHCGAECAPRRLAGADVQGTSEAVVQESLARGLPRNTVYLASGNRRMDGAILGAAVARNGGLLLLTPEADTTAADAAMDRLGNRSFVDRYVVVRGIGVVTGLGGYRLVARDGGVFSFGDAQFFGSTGGMRLNSPIVDMASTPSGDGYWLVAGDGGIFSFGDAAFHGSAGGMRPSAPVVGMAATPTGQGYWLVSRDGGVFAFGDAGFFGSARPIRLRSPIVGMASTASGRGYWLVAADGGIFSFGDAEFRGSMGGQALNSPIVGMDSTPSTRGYWLVAADGGIFAFGDAGFFGSTGGMRLNRPIVGMARTPNGRGYWLVASDGGVFAFAAPFLGSTGGMSLNQPIVGMAGGG